ncbi:MAG: Kiwa anti-phage protein KwaB-like domain-containing protein [Burkholderiaceae bacterium]
MNRITEFESYSYLAETNENSCLASLLEGSDFEYLKARVDRPEPDCRVQSIKDLKNAEGYVVKFVHNNQTVYAVKRSTSNWKTSYLKTHINIIFRNGELSAAENDAFAIEKNFDFYAYETAIFIASKRAFESAMKYRASYEQAFVTLRGTTVFSSLFTDMQPLIDYVGTNSIQLRRMAQIEKRALFNNPEFLRAIQTVNAQRGWGLNFDPQTQRLIPCEQTIKTIMQVLLDHRLLSEVTKFVYDVPNATQISNQ